VTRDAQAGQRLLHVLVEVVPVGCLEPITQGGVGRRLDGLGAGGLQLR